MSTPGSWKQTIPPILSTDQVKASVVNRPINALAERTDYLRALLDGTTTSEFMYLRNVAVTSTSQAGQMMAWSPEESAFAPALAKWDDELLNSDGTLKPAPTAAVAGILATKLTSTTGSIIIGGYVRDFSDLSVLFGTSTPSAGMYYLSADTAGRVTSSPPPLAILSLIYDGDGNILLPTIRFEHSTHDHKRYSLDETMWLTATVGNFPNFDIPAGATYGYDIENAPDEIKEIFTLYPGIAVFTEVDSGDNVPVALASIDENNIWWFDATAPDDLYMWLTAPNSHGPNIVRAIATESPEVLDITLTNGLAKVSKKDFTVETDTAGYTVVKDITDENVKKTGDVVEKIVAGDGLEIVSSSAPEEGQGQVELALSEFASRFIDASTINLNNALEYTDDGILYTAFPADRESSMTAAAGVSRWTSVGTKKCSVWLWVRGPSSGGAPLPSIDVEVLVFPDPTSTPQDIPVTPTTHTLTGAATTVNSKYYLMQTDVSDRFDVTSQAQVQYRLSYNNTNSWDFLVLRQGILVHGA